MVPDSGYFGSHKGQMEGLGWIHVLCQPTEPYIEAYLLATPRSHYRTLNPKRRPKTHPRRALLLKPKAVQLV